MTTEHRGVDIIVAGERDIKTPAEVMDPVSRSHLVKGLFVSVVAHALLIGLTSFGLYTDWMRFGVKMPQDIKALKKQAALAQADAAREQTASREAAASEADLSVPSAAPARDVPGVVRDANAVNTDRPAASTFSLDDELGLE